MRRGAAELRSIRAWALAVIVALVLPAAGAAAREGSFPQFQPTGSLFDHADMAYNPTDEWIFPSVIRADDHFDEPLGSFYLYAAPHDGPGGVSLFYADHLFGPWIEYEANPVIPRHWDGHYSVSHVSSPHALWVDDESSLFVYFHGENDVTRFATSKDGVTFEYGDVAVTAAGSGPGVTEAGYARVFEYAIPGRGNRYTMLFMDNLDNVRRIRLAISSDARSWHVDQVPLVHPRGAEGRNISSATHLAWRGSHYVAYHGSAGNIHLTEVGPAFDREDHLGVLYESTKAFPEHGRAAAPNLVLDGDNLHLFYEAGQRSRTTLAHAVADLSRLGPLQHPHYEFTDVAFPSTHYHAIHALATARFTTGCGTLERYCPTRSVTRAEMATFLVRALGLTDRSGSRYSDVVPGATHAGAIEAIAHAGLTQGCGDGRYCPDRELSRAEMATFLARALDLTPGSSTTQFADVVAGSTHARTIDALAREGITTGCGRTTHYCPDRSVTRAEMASFLIRGFDP